MENARALALLEEGTVLLVVGTLPQGGEGGAFEVGIDGRSWVVGPLFKGIKMIPVGVHFFYYRYACAPYEPSHDLPPNAHASAPYRTISKGGDEGALSGFFFEAQKEPAIVAWRWDAGEEQLVPCEESTLSPTSGQDPSAYKERLYALDRFLGPFPLDDEAYGRWGRWMSHVVMADVQRLLPGAGHKVSPYTSSHHSSLSPTGPSRKARASGEALPVLLDDDLHFTPVALPTSALRGGDRAEGQAATVTQSILDQSDHLAGLIRTAFGGSARGLLAEFQVSFVLFVVGHNYEGFDNWKALLKLLAASPRAPRRFRGLYVGLLRTLKAQLAECPADFFTTALGEECALFSWLHMLVDDCSSLPLPGEGHDELCAAAEDLTATVRRVFGWSIDCIIEAGEDAPVVVDE